jgi:cytochrome c-type biogenesis protein CcmF
MGLNDEDKEAWRAELERLGSKNGETQWSAEELRELKPGQSISIRQYDLTFEGTATRPGPNYREFAARFAVRRNGALIGFMEPAKRDFPSRQTATTKTVLMRHGLSQIYVSLGELKPDGSVGVRIYHKPLVLLIWFGPVAMALGGALSRSDRRLRIGAGEAAEEVLIDTAAAWLFASCKPREPSQAPAGHYACRSRPR